MQYYFGVYGFAITRQVTVNGLIFTPKESSFLEAKKLATDRSAFSLTAIGSSVSEPTRQTLFDLAAAMTFCQQQWVEITAPFSAADHSEAEAALPHRLDLAYRRWTSGALIINDAFDAQARRIFLELCLEKLSDKLFYEATGFRKALFRNVETWRQGESFLDVSYYLDFSALEILVRTATQDYRSPIAMLATPFLRNYRFDVVQNDPNSRERGVETYVHLRNALFHRGGFEIQINENGTPITLKLTDYEGFFRQLVPDVLLKVLGYDDGHINWNRWRDRMPFK